MQISEVSGFPFMGWGNLGVVTWETSIFLEITPQCSIIIAMEVTPFWAKSVDCIQKNGNAAIDVIEWYH